MPSSFAPGRLVWARLEGYPPWPASVIEPTEEHLERLGVDSIPSSERVVIFFNDGGQYQMMSTSALKPYDPKKSDKYYQNARRSYKTQLRGAIKQANDEYEILNELPPPAPSSPAPPSPSPPSPSPPSPSPPSPSPPSPSPPSPSPPSPSPPSPSPPSNKRPRSHAEVDEPDEPPPAKKPRAESDESDDDPPESLVKKRRAPKKKKKRVQHSDPTKSTEAPRKKTTKSKPRPSAPALPISKSARRRSRLSKKLESDDELASLPPSPRPSSPPLEDNKPPAHPQHAVKKVPEHVRKTIEAARTLSPNPSTPEKADVRDEHAGSGDDVYVKKAPPATPEKPHPPYAGKRPHPMPPKEEDVNEEEDHDLKIFPTPAKKGKKIAKQAARPSSPIPRKAHGKIKKKKRPSKTPDASSSRKLKSSRDDDLVVRKERRGDRLSKSAVSQKKKKVASKPVLHADSPPPLPPSARKRMKKETTLSSPVPVINLVPKSEPATEKATKGDDPSKKAGVDSSTVKDKSEMKDSKLFLKLRMQPPSDSATQAKASRPDKTPLSVKIPPAEPRPSSKTPVVKVPLSKPPAAIKIPLSRPLQAGTVRAKSIAPKVPLSGPLPMKLDDKRDPFGESELHGYSGRSSAVPESKVLDAIVVKEELTTSDAFENGVRKPDEEESVRILELEKLLEDEEASRLLVFAYEKSRGANRDAWVKKARQRASSMIRKKEAFEKVCSDVKAELEMFLKWHKEVVKKTSVSKDVIQKKEDELASRISSLKELMFSLKRINPGKMASELWALLDELWKVSPRLHVVLREVLVLWADLMYMFYTPPELQTGVNALAELEARLLNTGRKRKEDGAKAKAERKERSRVERKRRRSSVRRRTSSDEEEERRAVIVRDGRPTQAKKKRRVKPEPESDVVETPVKKKHRKEKGDDNDTDISPTSGKGKGVISSAEKARSRRKRIEEFSLEKFVETVALQLHNKTDGVEWSLEDCRTIAELLESCIEPRRENDPEKHYMQLLRVFGLVRQLRKVAAGKTDEDWEDLREEFVRLGPNNPRAMRKFVLHCSEIIEGRKKERPT